MGVYMRILAGATSQVVIALGLYLCVLTLAEVGGDRSVTRLIHLSGLLAGVLFVLSHVAAECGFQRAAYSDKEARFGVLTCSNDTDN